MTFLENQVKKEIAAAKRVGGGYLTILIIFWGIVGLVMLAGPARPLGLVFIGAAGYVFYRRKNKKGENK